MSVQYLLTIVKITQKRAKAGVLPPPEKMTICNLEIPQKAISPIVGLATVEDPIEPKADA